MLTLALGAADRPLRVVCIGAHPDDIEIGCGGTILRLAREGRLEHVDWLVLSGQGSPVRETEARAGAAAFLAGVPSSQVDVEGFRDGYFPSEIGAIKDRFEAMAATVRPDLVLTHRRDDLHQDHRVVNELAWNTFRSHLILEFEIPKYDGDLGNPNVFVDLPAAVARDKAEILARIFESQRDRHWFSEETFLALARLRGVESRASEGYAEGFHARKLVL
jgi:LmbE family N-acetylglucosaminyl deacetylase